MFPRAQEALSGLEVWVSQQAPSRGLQERQPSQPTSSGSCLPHPFSWNLRKTDRGHHGSCCQAQDPKMTLASKATRSPFISSMVAF